MTSVVVRFTAEGFHRWASAHGARAYLAARHRHLFHVRVDVGVDGADREIECHDLRDFCVSAFGDREKDGASCEMMAAALASEIIRRFGERRVVVEVMEDGEVGGLHIENPGRVPG